jgi:ABC-type nitrate/sulfonate/bicarbonate transport system substrate-binding protein
LLKQLLTLSAVLLLCSQPSAAQEKRNLRVAYVSPSYSQSINWIAKETGIFSKHGLNVELIYMSGASRPKRSWRAALIFHRMPDRRWCKRV